MKTHFFLASMMLLSYTVATAQSYQLSVVLDSFPSYTPANATIFLAGTMNGWNPNASNYQFQKQAGSYALSVPVKKGAIEFKLTGGSWEQGEAGPGGERAGNRSLQLNSDTVIHIVVKGWQDHFTKSEKMHTASKNVTILDRFYLPQLKRYRTLRIYLPPGYNKNQKRYPVVYLQDGQNIFDAYTSFAGEWDVDGFMDQTALPRAIVVAIDNGGDKRLNEYCPYGVKKIPGAEGDLYASFLGETLKPYIDKHYRTLKSKTNTFIAGSSMGGLISFYTALKYPKLFGNVGVFSPSFWVTDDKIYGDIKKLGPALNAFVYFYVGMQEGDTMPNDLLKAAQGLTAVSKSRVTVVIRSGGHHNEAAWRKEFPLFYQAAVSKKE
ncbi:alpha/beta hydrolase [Niabella soli]|uniref:Esterase n=1 Tax=Niabella soli DSM 19437 TaxID=929713 RepID=W0F1H1_9BACT|nr:alpha/beta hydrolase-fold protein [Niabella soli]AHF15309.1 esterase [Niabella soli DSM 19437]